MPSQPLIEPLRRRAEDLFRTDLSQVRIHESPLPASLGALAVAYGDNLIFAPGCYEPETPRGLRLLGHELAHAVQQREGRVPRNRSTGLTLIHNEQLEQEADQQGLLFASGGHFPRRSRRAPPLGALPSLALQAKVAPFGPWFDAQHAEAAWAAYQQFTYLFDVQDELDYLKALSKTAKIGEWKPTEQAGPLAELRARMMGFSQAVNTACAEISRAGEHWEYSNTAKDSWETQSQALAAFQQLVQDSNLPTVPGGQHMPLIPGIAFSKLRSRSGLWNKLAAWTKPASPWVPVALKRLVRDIYWMWKAGLYVDERTTAEQQARQVTDTPGSLRSWHMNQTGVLPHIGGQPVPANSNALHVHYLNTAKLVNNVAQNVGQAAAPIGYAEYTGTGIHGDSHKCKIVLDYKNGLFYITLTHYQFWRSLPNGSYEVAGQDFNPAYNSPWFYIDFMR